MQHSFITIYILDSISHEGGVQCSLISGKANGWYCTEYNKSPEMYTRLVLSTHACTLLYLPLFCVVKITHLQDAIIYLGSRQ